MPVFFGPYDEHRNNPVIIRFKLNTFTVPCAIITQNSPVTRDVCHWPHAGVQQKRIVLVFHFGLQVIHLFAEGSR